MNIKPFQKTYTEILLPNKDYKVIFTYAHGCTAHFTLAYNGISETYMGLMADTFMNTLRGLFRACPEFMDTIHDHSNRADFEALGFLHVEPTVDEVRLYRSLAEVKQPA